MTQFAWVKHGTGVWYVNRFLRQVRGLHEECTQEESRYHYLNCMMDLLKHQEQRVNEEMKSYTSHDMSARKKNFR